MQRDNWPLFSALRYLTCSQITKAHGPLTWQRSEFTKTSINCYREQSTKVRNMMSRVWKNIIYICLVILKGESWLVLCLALYRQDFFSLSPTQRLVSCAVCLAGAEMSFLFSSLFSWQYSGGEKKLLILKRTLLQNSTRTKVGIWESQNGLGWKRPLKAV